MYDAGDLISAHRVVVRVTDAVRAIRLQQKMESHPLAPGFEQGKDAVAARLPHGEIVALKGWWVVVSSCGSGSEQQEKGDPTHGTYSSWRTFATDRVRG